MKKVPIQITLDHEVYILVRQKFDNVSAVVNDFLKKILVDDKPENKAFFEVVKQTNDLKERIERQLAVWKENEKLIEKQAIKIQSQTRDLR